MKLIFASSVEMGRLVYGLMESLEGDGWDSEHYFEVPQVQYGKGGRLVLLWYRFRTYVLYPLKLLLRVRRAKAGDVFVVNSNTFYAPWFAIIGRKSGVRVIHLLYDLFPDTLGNRVPAAISSMIRWIMRSTFSKADGTVFISQQILDHVEREYPAVRNARVIPVGTDASWVTGDCELPQVEGCPVVLYSGNAGRLHDMDTLVNALRFLKQGGVQSIKFIFIGHGAAFSAMAGLSDENFSTVNGRLSETEWRKTMLEAQVGLVSLAEGAETIAFPSKVYSSLLAGHAIIAICAPDSDLGRLVSDNNCGWVIRPGDSGRLFDLLATIALDPSIVRPFQQAARRLAKEKFTLQKLADEWNDYLRVQG